MPLSSDFEATCDPREEVLSGHRIYVPSFDITPFVTLGENVIAEVFQKGYTLNDKVLRFSKVKVTRKTS